MKSRHDHTLALLTYRTFLSQRTSSLNRVPTQARSVFRLEPRATHDTSEFRDVSPPAAGPARRARANEKPKRTTRQAPRARAGGRVRRGGEASWLAVRTRDL